MDPRVGHNFVVGRRFLGSFFVSLNLESLLNLVVYFSKPLEILNFGEIFGLDNSIT